MISRRAPAECFVYITLPDATEPITAGRFELTTDRSGTPLGRFVYGKSYLGRSDAVPFDPVELKLASRVYETTAMKGMFGALRDASPDYWGRLVIERHVGKSPLGELDYLLCEIQRNALGRSRGRFSTKINARTNADGLPIGIVITPGQAHDVTAYPALMEEGRPRPRADACR